MKAPSSESVFEVGYDEIVGGIGQLAGHCMVVSSTQARRLYIVNHSCSSRRRGSSLSSDRAAETNLNSGPFVTMSLQLRHSNDGVSHGMSSMKVAEFDRGS